MNAPDPRAPAHPAPARHRISSGWILAGLLLAPAAWYLQLDAAYVAGALGCNADAHAPGANTVLIGVGVAVSVVLAMAALFAARQVWQRTSSEGPGGYHDALSSGHGRTRFLGLAGLIASSIFLVATLFSLLVPVLVSRCGG